MKIVKHLIFFFLSSFLLSVASCDTLLQKKKSGEDSMAQQIDSLRSALEESKNETNDLMQTVDEIQQCFREINDAEGIVTTQIAQGEGTQKQAIVDNILLIQEKMKLNRKLIDSLREQLRTSKGANTKMKSTLEEMVDNFQKQLDEKTARISALEEELQKKDIRIQEQSEQISSLNENVNSLAQSNEEQAKIIEAQDERQHTAYYAFGLKKELKKLHILEDGEVLRSSNFNPSYFTKIDYRVTKVIPLRSKSAKLLTSHPADSYTLDRDSNKEYTLRIQDPDRFWSVSKYLVIVVK
ncbi:MAG: hypothetical protein IJ816_04935 [Alloprevotella sp.]|nr:hypothetical protein [Alloprevotella sp.]